MNLLELKIKEVLDMHVSKRLDGKPASGRTQRSTREVVSNFFSTLVGAGYKVQDPKNVGDRHIQAVVHIWWHKRKTAPKTLQQYLSTMRKFFTWVGKPGLVRAAPDYLPDVDPKDLVVRTSADLSKSWTGNDVDLIGKLNEAREMDFRLGLILIMQLTFGLRRKEALLCRPWVAERGTSLRVHPGEGKGNRPRDIPIETEVQREVLKVVQSHIGKTDKLAWPTMTDGSVARFKQQESRYNNAMKALGFTKAGLGVTGHGLRAQFAENTAILQGFIPAAVGGTKGQMQAADLDVLRLQVSEALGHSRLSVTSAYYGNLTAAPKALKTDDVNSLIKIGIDALAAAGKIEKPPIERRVECYLLLHLCSDEGIDLTLNQVYSLWRLHCERHAAAWMPATGAVRQALEVAARQAIVRFGTMLDHVTASQPS